MQDSVLERWLAFLQTGFSPVELSELSLAHSSSSPPFELWGWLIANLSASRRSLLDDYQDCRWLFRVGSAKRRSRRREFLSASAANNPERKTRLQREIEAADREIDQLVYELYVIPS